MTFHTLFSMALLGAAVPISATPQFAHVFGDHAVLQRETKLRIWGFGARQGQVLKLRFESGLIPITIDPTGRWEANISPLAASSHGKAFTLLADGEVVDEIKDVLIGDVWLAAGQSNMQFAVKGMLKGMPESQSWIDSCNRPTVRFRRIGDPVLKDVRVEPEDLKARQTWGLMTPTSALGFSAAAAVFARQLSESLQVPIGIIDVSWGGKPIEPFIPREAYSTPLLQQIINLAGKGKLEELAHLHGGVIIRNPEGHPGAIFNARMNPIISYRLKGFIWYQGESNAGRGEDPREYRHKTRALVEGWRKRWNNQNLPFYFVQLPSYEPAPGWIRMREEQRRSLTIPNTGMVVTIDIRGEGIHPPDKISIGRRLAKLALDDAHGSTRGNAASPNYKSHRIEGNRIHIQFSNVETGLMIGNKPSMAAAVETKESTLNWFEVADKHGKWHTATARIEKQIVIVSSDKLLAPIAVRYACHVQPQGGNLYNRAGLPVSPFCTSLKLLPWADQATKK
ncbi:sialate O-acetylesterase [Verrucomicrobia bacterium]|nr:sialate O-acetylesterase [Verrucomicrobiota bacterium]